MRLTPEQVAIIRQSTAASFGPEARVWLFGSRVDDSRWGGDVDLLVEARVAPSIAELLTSKVTLEQQLQVPVDLIVDAPGRPPGPIATIARLTGVRLS
ncbi:nucleotidyltransferase family protein [Acidithiobacillus sp. IBUN Pt1247-S3]|uniref:nucleotidyltransferase family protein n=1 Tax=Acidithiobacillus sp. IBUN Pt1247-S3 TaxID=3166642 RepID=UPI0034E58586